MGRACSGESGCEKGQQWEKALELARKMVWQGPAPDVISYNTVIRQGLKALHLRMREVEAVGVYPRLAGISTVSV